MKIIGLTGPMASGKTKTASFFRAEGIPVFDADAEVHLMYGKGGEAVAAVAAAFPRAVVDGEVRNLKVTVPEDLVLMRTMLGMKAPEGRAVHKRF